MATLRTFPLVLGALVAMSGLAQSKFPGFVAGNLVVSRSTYTGDAKTVVAGQFLPPICPVTASCSGKATDGGAFPTAGSTGNVWNNAKVDGSFGVTAPIFLDQMSPAGALLGTLAIPPSLLVASFASKTELAVNLSTDGSELTLMGLVAPLNALDVSNSNTPGVYDPTNPVGSSYYRGILRISASGAMQVTLSNAYSGNNGRAAILANGLLYMAGNSNNGSSTPANVVAATGVQIAVPGQQRFDRYGSHAVRCSPQGFCKASTDSVDPFKEIRSVIQLIHDSFSAFIFASFCRRMRILRSTVASPTSARSAISCPPPTAPARGRSPRSGLPTEPIRSWRPSRPVRPRSPSLSTPRLHPRRPVLRADRHPRAQRRPETAERQMHRRALLRRHPAGGKQHVLPQPPAGLQRAGRVPVQVLDAAAADQLAVRLPDEAPPRVAKLRPARLHALDHGLGLVPRFGLPGDVAHDNRVAVEAGQTLQVAFMERLQMQAGGEQGGHDRVGREAAEARILGLAILTIRKSLFIWRKVVMLRRRKISHYEECVFVIWNAPPKSLN